MQSSGLVVHCRLDLFEHFAGIFSEPACASHSSVLLKLKVAAEKINLL